MHIRSAYVYVAIYIMICIVRYPVHNSLYEKSREAVRKLGFANPHQQVLCI